MTPQWGRARPTPCRAKGGRTGAGGGAALGVPLSHRGQRAALVRGDGVPNQVTAARATPCLPGSARLPRPVRT
jgi:hypothetical protein